MAETILIAEDDAHIAELIKIILEAKNYTTHWAKDGQEAVQAANQLKPDLILLDVMMPKLNGYEVLRSIKEKDELKHIPVIFVTVRGETDSKVVGLRLGGNDYITKPFDLDELIARVETALRIKGEHDHLRAQNRRLSELSMTDPLTGLYNRRYLMERFHEELERAKRYQYPIACLKVDVDDFKLLNEAHGHMKGDQVLQQLAILLKNTNRVVDILARYGGEQFLLILPQTNLGGAEAVGERYRQQVQSAQIFQNDPALRITVSLGVAAYATETIDTEEELLRQADEALLEAKRLGKNRLVLAQPGAAKPSAN
ncbi:MAG: diguanylate cyclase [Candidatus Firestonebacteria bacterium]|nr:diguanylate cyclase [Candidatus Firestonebacteria bacterium]